MGGVRFEALEEPPRLRVADTVGNEQFTLFLDSPVEPEPVSAEGFTYPVTDAAQVEISGFDLPGNTPVHLWDDEEELLRTADTEDGFEEPWGEYYLELCLPVKTYIRFAGSIKVVVERDRARIQFGNPTTVDIGSRSPRKKPAYTISTTKSTRDLMRAMSFLGESLVTTTPSRAFPNLRGYPPEIKLGDELAVPKDIETGPQPVTLALPLDLDHLFEAAPLIYYLNADVRPDTTPSVLVDGESIYSFDPSSFADDVETLLRHVFVLDCVVRSAGSYPVESVEVERLVDDISSDLSELYEADQGTRLREYLDVPTDPVARQAPEWPATAYVETDAKNVEAIPHLVNQLVPIRATGPERLSGTEARPAALAAFTRDSADTRAASEVFDGTASFVDTGPNDSNVSVWVGSDIPITANKFLVEGFRNRFERSASEQRSINVTIVCNEEWMSEEATTVQRYYDEQKELPFRATIHEYLDRASLAELLEEEIDFFHYVGHATSRGLECRDGYLDVSTVPSIGAETFFLNACQSYDQAKKLVEGGAIGGIATLSDITDDQANVVGRTVARLLNLGYPIRNALEIARTRSVVGGQYLSVGDDSFTLVPPNGVPNQCSVTQTTDGYEVTMTTFHSLRGAAGALSIPWAGSESNRYLIGKTNGPFEFSAAQLREFLELTNVPVDFDGEFRWAFDLAEELD